MTVQGKCSKPAGEYCRIHNPRPISLIMSKDDFGKYVNGEEKDSIGQRQLAETFPVSEYLHDELEARSLSPEELAEQMGVPSKVVFDLLDNGKFMDRNLADRLSAVLGTQPETWLGIQDSHLQHHSTNGKFETDTPQSQSKTLLAINKTLNNGRGSAALQDVVSALSSGDVENARAIISNEWDKIGSYPEVAGYLIKVGLFTPISFDSYKE